jgi:DNA primase
MVVAMPKNWHEINDMKKRVKMTEGTHQTMKETSAWMKLN